MKNKWFILDFGSGNTCRNEQKTIDRMIDEMASTDLLAHLRKLDYELVIKWQLFLEAGENAPLSGSSFVYAYNKAKEFGILTTASVFDRPSLDHLLQFEVPFVKVANNQEKYWIIGRVPRGIPVVYSMPASERPWITENMVKARYGGSEQTNYPLQCVSKYPARYDDYYVESLGFWLRKGISDHTVTWDLFLQYLPEVYECHYKLPDSTGLDAGLFARTPGQLKELGGLIG